MKRALAVISLAALLAAAAIGQSASGQPEFEVADVRPSAPDRTQRGGIQPGGRVDMSAYTLKSLMTLAWDIDGDRLVGGPKWLDTDRFDIVEDFEYNCTPRLRREVRAR